MKVIEKKKSLHANLREIMLAMKVDSVETYWAGSMNHDSLYSTYLKVRKELLPEGEWIHKFDDELFKIIRLK